MALAACGGNGGAGNTPEQDANDGGPLTGDTTTGDPDQNGAPPTLESPLSQEVLEQLSLDAWRRAGFDGDPTPIDASNAAGVGGASVLVADDGLDTAAALNGIVLSVGATGGLTLPHSAKALVNGVRETMKAALTPITSTVVDVTGLYDCPGGGTVRLTGAMVVTSGQTVVAALNANGDPVTKVVDGTINTAVRNLVIDFDACANSAAVGPTHRVWGIALLNTDNTIVADEDDAAPTFTDVNLAVDELLEAGLAVEDIVTGLRFRVPMRYGRSGGLDAYIDTSAKPIRPDPLGSLTATTVLNGATCATAVTFRRSPQPDTVTSGCTATP